MEHRTAVAGLAAVILGLGAGIAHGWSTEQLVAGQDPSALAVADMNSDGIADVIAVLAAPDGDRVAVYRRPTDARGWPAARLVGPMSETPAPTAVRTMVTGDFDGDGAVDVVLAGRAESLLYLLRGDGRGGLAAPEAVPVGEVVTAVTAGELGRPDGIADLAVAVDGPAGARLLLYERPRSFVWRHAPEAIELPTAATAVVLAFGGSQFADVVASVGDQLVVVHGRDSVAARQRPDDGGPRRVEHVALPGPAAAVAFGRVHEGGTTGLAILLDDGRLVTMPAASAVEPPSWERAADGLIEAARIAAPTGPAEMRAVSLRPELAQQLVVVSAGSMELLMTDPDHHLEVANLPATGNVAAIATWRAGVAATRSLLVGDSQGIVDVAERAANLFVVDDSDDDPDAVLDGVCATQQGVCTLRAAIEEANAAATWSLISFAGMGSFETTVFTLTALPPITRPMAIDGTTHLAGMVEIDGTASAASYGLKVSSGYVTLRGLAVVSFEGVGIHLASNGGGVVVEGCHVGVDRSGQLARGNAGDGIRVTATVVGDTIGGSAPAAGNVVSDNSNGIWLGDAAAGSPHLVLGNTVGTAADGSVALGNHFYGISVRGDFVRVGGSAPGEGNVVADSGSHGITSQGAGAVVAGNVVGLDPAGVVPMGNQHSGVWIQSGGTLGGLAAGSGNTVSANRIFGVDAASGAVIQGNRIGTTLDGLAPAGNGHEGVWILGTGVVVGGSEPGAANVISANRGGVRVAGAAGTVIQGNVIGVGADGVTPLGNLQAGVWLDGTTSALVGGSDLGDGNVIAHNGTSGVGIVGSSLFDTVRGNSMFANAGIGIDLGGDGESSNDPDDVDAGPNRMMNSPEVVWTLVEADGSLRIGYRLDSQPGSADYPVTVELFLADDPAGREGEVLLAIDTWTVDDYDAGWKAVTVPAAGPPVTGTDRVVGTATDSDGNTSEFGPTVAPTVAPTLFADGFETGSTSLWTATEP